jgi:hypothetical protein
MPQPFTWQYFLLNKEGKSFNYDTDIVVNDNPVPLENTPDGWQDKLVNFGRNTKYFGLFRSFTIPLKFVTEGKKVLRHLLYNTGIETVCSLAIKKLNNAWTYDPYFKGEIDFSKFSDEHDYATANVMEGGLAKLLKAKEGTNYEIKIEGDGLIPVRMTGLDFKCTINYAFIAGQTTPLVSTTYTLGYQFASQEGTSIGVVTGSSPFQSTKNFDYKTNNDRWVLWSTQRAVTFNFKHPLTYQATSNGNIHIYFLKNTGTFQDIIPTQAVTAGMHTFNIDTTINLAVGEKLFIILDTGIGINVFDGLANISYSSKALSSNIKAKTAASVLKELIKVLSDNEFTAISDLLDNRTDIVITCGDAIRGLPGAVMKTTFSDFFKAMYCSPLRAALGLDNNQARMESFEYFFDPTTLIYDLGEINNLKTSIAEDLIYNSVKVGYQDQKYDDVNGRDEFNSTQQYQLPITRIVKEWDLVSPYRADCYGMEFVRANLTEKKTTDSDSDNDIFIIQVQEVKLLNDVFVDVTFGNGTLLINALVPNEIITGVKIRIIGSTSNDGDYLILIASTLFTQTQLNIDHNFVPGTQNVKVQFYGYEPKKGPYNTTPTGLISPDSVFNLELSPKRCLYAHGNYLHSILDKLETKNITFQSALKNAEVVSNVGGVIVTEKADVLVNDLEPKVFLPYYFTFDCNVPVDLVDLMALFSKGYFSFRWLGNTYKGFPIDISIKPSDNDSQEFKLLACPDNDMSKLI